MSKWMRCEMDAHATHLEHALAPASVRVPPERELATAKDEVVCLRYESEGY